MKKSIFILIICFLFSNLYSQNISVDRAKREITSVGTNGDTNIFICKSKQKKSEFYPVFYKKDSSVWSGLTFFDLKDFDSQTNDIYLSKQPVLLAGFSLKKKAKIKIKKSFTVRVGMMPSFGWYIGKKKPGRYKQIGYNVKIVSADSLSFDGYVYYYFQKQSIFKRFFKKHRLKKRFKKLPVLMGVNGPEVIFKNDKIEEGGQERAIYYCFKLKENLITQKK